MAAKVMDNLKVKAEEGEEEEEEEDLVDPANEIKEKCGEAQCGAAKVGWLAVDGWAVTVV
jgi:hypothetical protein